MHRFPFEPFKGYGTFELEEFKLKLNLLYFQIAMA